MPPNLIRCFVLILAAAALSSAAPASADEPLLFISSFATGKDGAISSFRLDPATGRLTPVARTPGVENCYFITLSPDQKFLYAIHGRDFTGKEDVQVAAYAIVGQTGQLKLLNRQTTRGTVSCYLHLDSTGKTLLVANYGSGSVASMPVREDGSLGEVVSLMQHAGRGADPERQEGPHAHSILPSPDNRFALAADLGIDQVLVYRLDAAKATLSASNVPPGKTPRGAGPRHMVFHPNGKHLYVIDELGGAVTVFTYDAQSGALAEQQTIPTLPKDFRGKNLCADLKVTPNGRFLYATNRGHDSIAAYSIGQDGRLTLVAIEPSLGKEAQNLAILPGSDLLLCANMASSNVVAFRINAETGRLTAIGSPTSVPSPSCIQLLRPE